MARATEKIDEPTVSLPVLDEGLSYFPLPAISNDYHYRALPREMIVDQGEGSDQWTVPIESLTAYILENGCAYGWKQLGNDGAAGKEGAEEKGKGRTNRQTKIEDGTYKFGAGGGGRAKSTREKEAEAYMIGLVGERIRETNNKKGKAKTWYEDHGGTPESVFLSMCELVAATVEGAVAEDLYAKNWPSHDAKIKDIVRVIEKAKIAKSAIQAKKTEGDALGLAA